MASSPDPRSRGRSGGTFQMAIGAAAILIVAILIFLLSYDKSDGTGQQPAVITLPPSQPQAPAAPVAPQPVLRLGEAAHQPIPPPQEIRAALQLSDKAIMREAVSIERLNGVVCGEVSPNGEENGFRRFVYIGSARIGKVDDGSPDFKKYLDLVCVPQPGR